MTQHHHGAGAGPSLQAGLRRHVPTTGTRQIRPGELLHASAEVHAGVQDLRRLTATLAAHPFDASAANAIIKLLNSPRWHQARSCWQLVQAAQGPLEHCHRDSDHGPEAEVDHEVAHHDTATSPTFSLTSSGTGDGHDLALPGQLVGVQRVEDVLVELQQFHEGCPTSSSTTTTANAAAPSRRSTC